MFTIKSISRMFSILFAVVFMLALTFSGLDITPAQAAGIRYAKPGGTGDCSSWANACTVKTALTGAVSGGEIWAAAGTHKPTTLGTDRTATFPLKSGVAVYGGFVGTETARSQRNPAANITILSGDIDNNDSQTPIITDLTTVTGNTTNSYHVVTNAIGTTLDGFTITAGNANGADEYSNGSGGGMFNVAGGGSSFLTGVTFSGNSATSNGGGMYSSTLADSVLANVTFSGNKAAKGGGMYNWDNSPTLTNVTFSGNSASTGGGMYNLFSWGTPMLTNVTFSGNSATSYGGGMFNDGSDPTIRNTILWGNTAGTAGAQINNAGSPVVSDSVVQGGFAGTNIITADPLLGTLANYGGSTQTIPLLPGSSAIDTGNNTTCPITDQRGVARPQGAYCDIGAFEVLNTSPTSTPSPTNTPTSTPTSTSTAATPIVTLTPTLTSTTTPTAMPTSSWDVYLPLILRNEISGPTPTPTATLTPGPETPTPTPTPTATPSAAIVPKDGTWTGGSFTNLPYISFDVSGGGTQIPRLTLATIGCGDSVGASFFGATSITNGAFSASGGIGGTLTGTFDTANTAHGTYRVGRGYPCFGFVTGTWSASTP